jgi:molybdenum cofactor guanylyltransferase
LKPAAFGGAQGTAEAFILAGGRSSRMGEDKSLVQLAGKPLIQHAGDNLAAAGVTFRIAGAQSDLSGFAPVVEDGSSESGLGPLSGICGALEVTATAFAVFLPVDLPMMPGSFIAYLMHHAGITQSAFTVISVAGFVQTFPVVISRNALPMLRESQRSADRNCLRAFRNAASCLHEPFTVLAIENLLQSGQVSHPQGLAPALWFLNINSRMTLSHAEDLVGHLFQVS